MAYLGKTPSQAVRSRFYFTASGGETSLAPAQVTGLSFTDANYVDVSLNGVALVSGTDYTATPSTNTISSLAALTASDVVEIVVYDVFSVFGGNVNGDFNISGGTLAAEAVTVTGLTTTGNINFGDSDKAIFGAGSDLNVWHNGSHSYVQDTGTGNLYLAGSNVIISNPTATETMAYFDDDGGASLWYNNAVKIATTNTGVNVTGTVGINTASPAYTIDAASSGNTQIHLKASGQSDGLEIGQLSADGGNAITATNNNYLKFGTNNTERLRITSGGNVGIGATSPDHNLTLQANTNPIFEMVQVAGGPYKHQIAVGGNDLQLRASSGALVMYTGNADGASSTERMRITSGGNVGINTSSPAGVLDVRTGGTQQVIIGNSGAYTGSEYGELLFKEQNTELARVKWNPSGNTFQLINNIAGPMTFATSNTERMRIDSSGNVGINTSSPSGVLHTAGSGDQTVTLQAGGESKLEMKIDGNSDGCSIRFSDSDAASQGQIRYQHSTDALGFYTNGNNERLRIDNGGNVLVNQTSTSSPGFSNTTTGLAFSDSGRVFSSASGAASSFNRNTSDGAVIHVRKAGTLVGVLSVTDSDNFSLDCQTSSHSGITFGTANVIPRVNGANNDGNVDLGLGDKKWQNIYATNNAIQTSDETEKQNIASLTNAEITAAKAISKLFKTFKWKHRVAAEGDAARTHSGVIAQEVQTAMTDAGLDAADYAFWCSDTWWETSTDVPAVEADEEAGVEAKDAYTRIDTYYTADEAPEGATQRTRLGIRYAELMSFVGAATEQRLADIETRLTALENAE